MGYQSRKHKIVKIIDEEGEASVKELASLAAASEATIRRDLLQLAGEGLVYRTHGGAMKPGLIDRPLDFAQKAARHLAQKDFLCSLAAKEILDGDTIFMDCGSTVFCLCPYLKNRRIKVVTNSLPVVHELGGTRVSLNLIGGEYDPERQAAHGSMAVEHIRRYHAGKAFVGVDGVSAAHGLTAHSEKEAAVTLTMMQQADTVYLLCDATKINRDAYLQFAGLQAVDVLVTDAGDELLGDFRQAVRKVLNR